MNPAILRDLHTLSQLGAVGELSDGELLERVEGGFPDVSRAALAALVDRHGPMVWRVGRQVLGDEHDAEDAFQATFLVLVRKAATIRKRDSVASWLYGVVRQVARRAKAKAAFRREHERRAAMARGSADDGGRDESWVELHEELDRLSEKYREPLVLCYLEGLSAEAAAHRLGCPRGTVLSRLSRARERLRGKLDRRGLTMPSGFSASERPLPMIPASVAEGLKQSTIRAASRAAGRAAVDVSSASVTLAWEVSRAMTLMKVRIAAAVFLAFGTIGLGGMLLWTGLARGGGQEGVAPAIRAASDAPPKPQGEADTDNRFEMMGTVKVEGTGEPVAGARVQVIVGTSGGLHDRRETLTGADGRYSLKLPEGNAQGSFLRPPDGYWVPDPNSMFGLFAVGRDRPAYRKDYVVRRGTPWPFRLEAGAGRPIRTGVVGFYALPGEFPLIFQSEADDRGIARVTLPVEGAKLTVSARPGLAATGRQSLVKLEWDGGFRPDAVERVDPAEGTGRDRRVRMADREGRSATVTGEVTPEVSAGKLVLVASFPEPEPQAYGLASGRVVDEGGRPIPGAKATLAFLYSASSHLSSLEKHTTTTDADGRYTLHDIPRQSHEGQPTRFSVGVSKDGFAGEDTSYEEFRPGADGSMGIPTIRMGAGITVKGRAVDPEGRPVRGAWVRLGGGYSSFRHNTKTDSEGRFTLRDLRKGVVPVTVFYDNLMGMEELVVAGAGEDLEIKLRPPQTPVPAAAAATKRPEAGDIAPEWQAAEWLDGQPIRLADLRGKVVFLDFWGLWCSPCVRSLPAIEKLRRKYEPKGVAFVSIHTPGEKPAQVRKLLALKGAMLSCALDAGPDDPARGTTARSYGVGGYPTIVLIDRSGKVAFRTDDQKVAQPMMEAVVKELGFNGGEMTSEKADLLTERVLERAIEEVVGHP